MQRYTELPTSASRGYGWRDAPAERLPFPDGSFDVALCSLGLQFFRDRPAALGEAHRVLGPDGRVAVGLVGPTPPPFAILEDALSRHVNLEAAKFVGQVFSLHDPDEIRGLLGGAGFGDVAVDTTPLRLTLPAPVEFLWQ